MRIAVIIPTTNGPVQIERVTRLLRAPLSQVITIDDFVPNQELALRYHALTDQSGPLRELILIGDARFELCLDRLPDMGRSWELPVAFAHWAIDRGHELVTSNADLVIWATGVVKSGREIAEENYHLKTKIRTSLPLLATYGDATRLIVLLPGNTRVAEVAAISTELHYAEVATVNDVDGGIAILEKATITSKPTEIAPASFQATIGPRHRGAMIGIVFAVLIVAGGGGLLWLAQGLRPPAFQAVSASVDAPERTFDSADFRAELLPEGSVNPSSSQRMPEATKSVQENEVASPLVLVQHRAPPGTSCINVLVGTASAVRLIQHMKNDILPPSNLAGLCALSFEIDGKKVSARLGLPTEFLARVIPSDRISSVEVGKLNVHLFHLIDGAPPLVYELTFSNSSGGQMIVKHSLVRL